MIKKLFFAVLTIVTLHTGAQNFSAMYPFTGVQSGTANTGTVDPTPTPSVNGLSFGSFSAIGTPSIPNSSGAFVFDTWGTGATNGNDVSFTGALDVGKYYEVNVTPVNNTTMTINSITFNMARSSTGPRHWGVRGSADTYSVNLPASINPANANLSVQFGDRFFWSLDSYTIASGKQERGSYITPGALYANLTSSVSFRFYAWDAESLAGSYRVDTVTFNGVLTLYVGLNKVTQDLNSQFKIYPNPSNDGMATIEVTKTNFSKVEVINILGTIVATQNGILNDKIKLDLTALPEGTYFVRITSDDKIATEKLIISR